MGSPKKPGSPANRPLPSSIAPTDTIIAANSAKISDDKVVKREIVDKTFKGVVSVPELIGNSNTSPVKPSTNKVNEPKLAPPTIYPSMSTADTTNDKQFKPEINLFSPPHIQNGESVGSLVDSLDLHGNPQPSVENFGGYNKADFKDWESSEDDEADKAVSGKKARSRSSTKKKGPDPNGRRVGRKLVMWHRPRMMEKLLMHVQYECHRRAIIIPWEKVVKRLSPGSSGFAALQHLNKLRDILVSEGHLVPPLLGKKHVKQDPTIRGHIRDMDSDSPIATRIVRWDEVIEDRKQNLVVPGINRGSGNYPRTSTPTGVPHTIHSVTKPAEGRRSRIPAEEIAAKNAPATPVVKERKKPGPKLGSKNKPRVPKIPAPARSPSLDPAELASDDSYTPNVKTKGKYGLRKVTKKSTKEVDEESVATVDDNGAPIPLPSPASGHSKFAGIPLTPPASLSIKLLLRPELLARFPRGESKPAVNYESGSDAYEDTPDSDAYEDTLDSDAYEDTPDTEWDSDEYGDEDAAGSDEELQDPPQQMPSGRPSTFYEELLYAQYAPAAAEKIHSNRSYQGILEHGNQAEYKNSIRSGADPIVNGLDYKRARQHARKATESATQFLADGPDMISRKNIAHVAQHDVETDMVHGYDSQPTAPRIYGNYSEHEGTSSSIDESMEDRRQDRNAFFDTVLGGYGDDDQMTNGNNQYAPNGDEGHGVKADDMFSGTYENNFNAYSTYDASYVDGICDAPSFNIHVDNSSNTANDNTPSTSYPSSAYSSSNNASFSTNDMYNAPAYAGQNNVGGSFGVLRSSPSPVLSASNFGNFDHNDYQVVYSSFNGLGNDENTYPVSSVGAFIPEFFGDEAIV